MFLETQESAGIGADSPARVQATLEMRLVRLPLALGLTLTRRLLGCDTFVFVRRILMLFFDGFIVPVIILRFKVVISFFVLLSLKFIAFIAFIAFIVILNRPRTFVHLELRVVSKLTLKKPHSFAEPHFLCCSMNECLDDANLEGDDFLACLDLLPAAPVPLNPLTTIDNV